MTDQSRVEAVADGIEEILPGKLLLSFDRDFAIDVAKAAIKANDAWLKEQGWEMAPAGSLLASRRASAPPLWQRKGLGLDWVILDEATKITPEMWDELRRQKKGTDQ